MDEYQRVCIPKAAVSLQQMSSEYRLNASSFHCMSTHDPTVHHLHYMSLMDQPTCFHPCWTASVESKPGSCSAGWIRDHAAKSEHHPDSNLSSLPCTMGCLLIPIRTPITRRGLLAPLVSAFGRYGPPPHGPHSLTHSLTARSPQDLHADDTVVGSHPRPFNHDNSPPPLPLLTPQCPAHCLHVVDRCA